MKENLKKILQDKFSLSVWKELDKRYFFIEADSKELREMLACLKEEGFGHLSSISCVDYPAKNRFSLSYNLFSYAAKILITVKVYIPRDTAEFLSVTDIHYPAKFFERDIAEMFGVKFNGNDNLNKFILDEWNGPPPMRKDFHTRDYAASHFSWRRYQPKWAEELGITEENLKGEDLEIL